MKILTIVRQVPDAESGLRISDNQIDFSSTQLVMDTMDEYGVEQALRLREAGEGIEVIAVAIGPAKVDEVLRNALALGADRAVHVKTDTSLDAITLSKIVSDIVTTEDAQLIFNGGRQSDSDSEALGAAIAERLGWPQLTWTTELQLQNESLTGRHDTDDGSEAFSVELPAVITTQQGLNEPRFPTLPNIVKARKKELRTESLEQYGVTPLVRTLKVELQPRSRLRNIIKIDDDPAGAAAKLADVLRKEAGVHA